MVNTIYFFNKALIAYQYIYIYIYISLGLGIFCISRGGWCSGIVKGPYRVDL